MKYRVVKIIISIGYYYLIKFTHLVYRIIGKDYTCNCVILYYHSILDNERDKFARQMDLLLKYTVPIGADQITDRNNGRNYTIVTFDDGFISVLNNATPELVKRGIPFTVFFPTHCLGKVPEWHMDKNKINNNEIVMSIEQLKQLPNGLVTIGSHTLTHPNLTMISEENAKFEIQESKNQLETIIEKEVNLFSFPYGMYNNELISLVTDSGYERMFTIIPELSKMNNSNKVFGRITSNPTDWRIEFWLKIQGAYSWLPFVFSIKRKLQNLITI
jgi:peptidoglycan/xylan/chitin deacetylase (PgdA/CDA1 family)